MFVIFVLHAEYRGRVITKGPKREDVSIIRIGYHAVLVENSHDGLLGPITIALLHSHQ